MRISDWSSDVCSSDLTRGAEFSRSVAKIVNEAERLAAAGVVEVTLLGQNVNAYHGAGPDGADWSLAQLIARLADVPGIARIRYTTPHPRALAYDPVRAPGRTCAFIPSPHLPVQRGGTE